MKYGIITSVWGDEYLNFYFSYILPHTLKSINNDTIIILSVLDYEFDKIQHLINESYQHYIDKIFLVNNNVSSNDKYTLMARLDKNAIRVAMREKNIYSFIAQNPDSLISKSMFDTIYSCDKKIIVIPGIRILKEEFLLIYGSLLSYSDEQILDYAITAPHPITKALSRKGGYKVYDSGWPSVLYEIDLANNRIFGVGFHYHPINFEINNQTSFIDDHRTLDDIFLSELSYSLDHDFHFLNHSSEGFILEFSSLNTHRRQQLYNNLTNDHINRFMNQNCCDMHRRFASKCFTWSNKPEDVAQNPFCGVFPPVGING